MISIGIIAASGKGGVVFYIYGSESPAVHGTFIPDGFYGGFPQYKRLDSSIMVWAEDFESEYKISDYGDYNPSNAYFRNNKQSGIAPWEGTGWTRVNGSGIPIISLTPPMPIAMNISGAGVGAGQPIDAPVVDIINGKPHYYVADGVSFPFGNDLHDIRWTDEFPETGGFAWVCLFRSLIRLCYWSSEDVDYPDQVTTWTVGPQGASPTPTIVAVY